MSSPALIGRCIALLAAVAFVLPAAAQTCSSLSAYLEDVHANYRPIDEHTDFAAAQDEVKQLRLSLTQAATAAQDCRCLQVFNGLMDAASFARQAEAADNEKDFTYRLNRSILSYNSALDLLNHCPH